MDDGSTSTVSGPPKPAPTPGPYHGRRRGALRPQIREDRYPSPLSSTPVKLRKISDNLYKPLPVSTEENASEEGRKATVLAEANQFTQKSREQQAGWRVADHLYNEAKEEYDRLLAGLTKVPKGGVVQARTKDDIRQQLATQGPTHMDVPLPPGDDIDGFLDPFTVPAPWELRKDLRGRKYYFNKETKRMSKEPPVYLWETKVDHLEKLTPRPDGEGWQYKESDAERRKRLRMKRMFDANLEKERIRRKEDPDDDEIIEDVVEALVSAVEDGIRRENARIAHEQRKIERSVWHPATLGFRMKPMPPGAQRASEFEDDEPMGPRRGDTPAVSDTGRQGDARLAEDGGGGVGVCGTDTMGEQANHTQQQQEVQQTSSGLLPAWNQMGAAAEGLTEEQGAEAKEHPQEAEAEAGAGTGKEEKEEEEEEEEDDTLPVVSDLPVAAVYVTKDGTVLPTLIPKYLLPEPEVPELTMQQKLQELSQSFSQAIVQSMSGVAGSSASLAALRDEVRIVGWDAVMKRLLREAKKSAGRSTHKLTKKAKKRTKKLRKRLKRLKRRAGVAKARARTKLKRIERDIRREGAMILVAKAKATLKHMKDTAPGAIKGAVVRAGTSLRALPGLARGAEDGPDEADGNGDAPDGSDSASLMADAFGKLPQQDSSTILTSEEPSTIADVSSSDESEEEKAEPEVEMPKDMTPVPTPHADTATITLTLRCNPPPLCVVRKVNPVKLTAERIADAAREQADAIAAAKRRRDANLHGHDGSVEELTRSQEGTTSERRKGKMKKNKKSKKGNNQRNESDAEPDTVSNENGDAYSDTGLRSESSAGPERDGLSVAASAAGGNGSGDRLEGHGAEAEEQAAGRPKRRTLLFDTSQRKRFEHLLLTELAAAADLDVSHFCIAEVVRLPSYSPDAVASQAIVEQRARIEESVRESMEEQFDRLMEEQQLAQEQALQTRRSDTSWAQAEPAVDAVSAELGTITHSAEKTHLDERKDDGEGDIHPDNAEGAACSLQHADGAETVPGAEDAKDADLGDQEGHNAEDFAMGERGAQSNSAPPPPPRRHPATLPSSKSIVMRRPQSAAALALGRFVNRHGYPYWIAEMSRNIARAATCQLASSPAGVSRSDAEKALNAAHDLLLVKPYELFSVPDNPRAVKRMRQAAWNRHRRYQQNMAALMLEDAKRFATLKLPPHLQRTSWSITSLRTYQKFKGCINPATGIVGPGAQHALPAASVSASSSDGAQPGTELTQPHDTAIDSGTLAGTAAAGDPVNSSAAADGSLVSSGSHAGVASKESRGASGDRRGASGGVTEHAAPPGPPPGLEQYGWCSDSEYCRVVVTVSVKHQVVAQTADSSATSAEAQDEHAGADGEEAGGAAAASDKGPQPKPKPRKHRLEMPADLRTWTAADVVHDLVDMFSRPESSIWKGGISRNLLYVECQESGSQKLFKRWESYWSHVISPVYFGYSTARIVTKSERKRRILEERARQRGDDLPPGVTADMANLDALYGAPKVRGAERSVSSKSGHSGRSARKRRTAAEEEEDWVNDPFYIPTAGMTWDPLVLERKYKIAEARYQKVLKTGLVGGERMNPVQYKAMKERDSALRRLKLGRARQRRIDENGGVLQRGYVPLVEKRVFTDNEVREWKKEVMADQYIKRQIRRRAEEDARERRRVAMAVRNRFFKAKAWMYEQLIHSNPRAEEMTKALADANANDAEPHDVRATEKEIEKKRLDRLRLLSRNKREVTASLMMMHYMLRANRFPNLDGGPTPATGAAVAGNEDGGPGVVQKRQSSMFQAAESTGWDDASSIQQSVLTEATFDCSSDEDQDYDDNSLSNAKGGAAPTDADGVEEKKERSHKKKGSKVFDPTDPALQDASMLKSDILRVLDGAARIMRDHHGWDPENDLPIWAEAEAEDEQTLTGSSAEDGFDDAPADDSSTITSSDLTMANRSRKRRAGADSITSQSSHTHLSQLSRELAWVFRPEENYVPSREDKALYKVGAIMQYLRWVQVVVTAPEFREALVQFPTDEAGIMTTPEFELFVKVTLEVDAIYTPIKKRVMKSLEAVERRRRLVAQRKQEAQERRVDRKASQTAAIDEREELRKKAEEAQRLEEEIERNAEEASAKRELLAEQRKEERKKRPKKRDVPKWEEGHQHVFVVMPGRPYFCCLCRERRDRHAIDTLEEEETEWMKTLPELMQGRAEEEEVEIHDRVAAELRAKNECAPPEQTMTSAELGEKIAQEAEAQFEARMEQIRSEEAERHNMFREEVHARKAVLHEISESERPYRYVQERAQTTFAGLISNMTQPSPYATRLKFIRALTLRDGRLTLQVEDPNDSRHYLIKMFPVLYEDDETFLLHESSKLMLLRHHNVIKVHDCNIHTIQNFTFTGQHRRFWRIAIVKLQYMDPHTLTDRLRFLEDVDNDQLLTYMRQLISALCAMHALDHIHRNLGPHCVFLDKEEDQIRLGMPMVFRNPRDTGDRSTFNRSDWGFHPSRPPEVRRGKPLDNKADVWAFGCCLCYWVCKRFPDMDVESLSDLFRLIPLKFGPWIAEALTMALQPNPRFRASSTTMFEYLHQRHVHHDVRVEPRKKTMPPIPRPPRPQAVKKTKVESEPEPEAERHADRESVAEPEQEPEAEPESKPVAEPAPASGRESAPEPEQARESEPQAEEPEPKSRPALKQERDKEWQQEDEPPELPEVQPEQRRDESEDRILEHQQPQHADEEAKERSSSPLGEHTSTEPSLSAPAESTPQPAATADTAFPPQETQPGEGTEVKEGEPELPPVQPDTQR